MIEEELNKILKRMWKLKEKMDSGEVLLEDEGEYWMENLPTIKLYYFKNSMLWFKYPDIKMQR